nr:hypothetical protein [Lachnospiraceae bacterium]
MVKDKLCKKYLYIAGLCLLLFVGCGKKDNNVSSGVKTSSDGEYVTEVVNNTSFINGDFLKAEVIDGKQLYLFVNMSGKDGIFKRDLKVSYYE